MRRRFFVVLALAPIAACSGSSRHGGFDDGSGGSDGGGGIGDDAGSRSGDDGGVGTFGDGGGNGGSVCQWHDGTDHDGDGWSANDGDCNDCDPNANPGAYDYPNNHVDEDCDGTPDDEPAGCDTSLAFDSKDAFDAVKAVDICRPKTAENAQGPQRHWGPIDAEFVRCDGSPALTSNPNWDLGHGNLPKLGANLPLQGKRMFVLSSGSARDPSDPGYQDVGGFDKGYTCTPPTGFPHEAPACPGSITGAPHDCMGLRIVMRVPTNAKSFSYSQNFFTYEFPNWICTEFNDYFVALLTPRLPNLKDANIAFDQAGNPVSVNNSLLQVCDTQSAGGKTFGCPLGSSTLQKTGFGTDTGGSNHAATGWLKTTAPVDTMKGKDVTLVFAIWDSGDGILDSTTLVDSFAWSVDPASGANTVPQPK